MICFSSLTIIESGCCYPPSVMLILNSFCLNTTVWSCTSLWTIFFTSTSLSAWGMESEVIFSTQRFNSDVKTTSDFKSSILSWRRSSLFLAFPKLSFVLLIAFWIGVVALFMFTAELPSFSPEPVQLEFVSALYFESLAFPWFCCRQTPTYMNDVNETCWEVWYLPVIITKYTFSFINMWLKLR